jgi:hypothetical protein
MRDYLKGFCREFSGLAAAVLLSVVLGNCALAALTYLGVL